MARVILVGFKQRGQSPEQAQEYIEELAMLARTADYAEVFREIYTLDDIHPGTLIGKGKLERLRLAVAHYECDRVFFDMELTPMQLRNIEKILNCNVTDRAGLILEIFSANAQTATARTQVELARLQYELPRLRRMWTHLSRERGGIGLKGSGEQEIETDRRRIRQRITKLKEDLVKLERQEATRRKHRDAVVRVALVGYTNVGKSTIMNILSKADVLAENKLFATLDTTVRKVTLSGVPFLLSDTVGFIRKLPHSLVESFKSTLAEAAEADLLLHVVDVSSPFYIEHMGVVRDTLAELKAAEKPTILVFNKIDRLSPEDVEDLERTWAVRVQQPCVFLSAGERLGIEKLRQMVTERVRDIYATRYPGLLATLLPDAFSYEQGQT